MAYQDPEKVMPPRDINQEMSVSPWIPDNQLTLTRIPNTQITCRLCRGSRYVAPISNGNIVRGLVPCPNCDCTGVQMSDHIDTLWGRNR